VDDGKHAMPNMPVLSSTDLRPQLYRLAAVVRHLEEAGSQPDCEDVAADRDVVEDLGEQLVLQVWMRLAIKRLKDPLAESNSRSAPQDRIIYTACRKLGLIRRIETRCQAAERFIAFGGSALWAALVSQEFEKMANLIFVEGIGRLRITKSHQHLLIPNRIDIDLA